MAKVVPELVRKYNIGTFKKLLDHKEAIMYALSVGCNQDPMNKGDLKFTYENNPDFQIIQSFPSQFSVLDLEMIRKCPGLPDYNPMALLHGNQVIDFYSPLKIGQHLRSENSIVDVADKKSGALILVESMLYDEADTRVGRCRANLFIRGLGGFGDKGQVEQDRFPKPSSDKPIDEITLPIAPNQAHLYRIASGDVNPLHVDPDQAKEGGFDQPILHGLCTMGFSTRAYQTVFDHHSFSKIGTMFTAPTVPGMTLQVKFFDTENQNQKCFETIAYKANEGIESGNIIAKGFFETS